MFLPLLLIIYCRLSSAAHLQHYTFVLGFRHKGSSTGLHCKQKNSMSIHVISNQPWEWKAGSRVFHNSWGKCYLKILLSCLKMEVLDPSRVWPFLGWIPLRGLSHSTMTEREFFLSLEKKDIQKHDSSCFTSVMWQSDSKGYSTCPRLQAH